MVMVACNMVVPDGFELGASCAGPHAATSKTKVDIPPVNTFRTILKSKSASPCQDGFCRPSFFGTKPQSDAIIRGGHCSVRTIALERSNPET